MNSNKVHFAWLDTMRFVAAFLVLFCHSRNDYFLKYNFLDADQQGPITFLFYTLGRLGSEAVFAFFILSGFLVGGPGLERIKNGTFRLRSYTIDRSVRIILPLISAIVLYIIVALCIGEELYWGRVIGNLLSLQCFCCEPLVSPFWSLSYEVWFYITLAAFALAMRENRWGYVLSAACIVVYVRMNPLYFMMWLIGAVAYLTRPKRINKWQFCISVFILLLAMALTQMTKASKAMSFNLPSFGEGYNVLLCIAMGWFVQQVILLEPKKTWLKKIEQASGKWANFSYTLYLTHRITLLAIFSLWLEKEQGTMTMNDFGVYILILMTCLAVAYATYYIAERHTLQVKTCIKKKIGIQN